jgi:hypothetical protein
MMKHNDTVWIPVTVDENWGMGLIYRDTPNWPMLSLPDHPALPKLAAWLHEHPDAYAEFRRMEDEMVKWSSLYQWFGSDLKTFRSLVATLTPDAPATEGDRDG